MRSAPNGARRGEREATRPCSGADQTGCLGSLQRVEHVVEPAVERRRDERDIDLLAGDGRHIEHVEVRRRESVEADGDEPRSDRLSWPARAVAEEQRVSSRLPDSVLRIEITADSFDDGRRRRRVEASERHDFDRGE